MEFAQARVQARFGERPTELHWRRLEAMRELPAFLEAARGTGLGRWVAGLHDRSGTNEVEIALRERMRSTIRELAGWMPEPWCAAVMWTRHLVDLPALVHLARGHRPFPWMREDPLLQRYVAADAEACRVVLANEPQLDFLAPALRGEAAQVWKPGMVPDASAVRDAWLRRWRSLWPRMGGEARASVEDIERCIQRNLADLCAASADRGAASRRIFEQQLRRLFRSSPLLPAAAFAYLAIAALDAARLRRELLLRGLFPEAASRP